MVFWGRAKKAQTRRLGEGGRNKTEKRERPYGHLAGGCALRKLLLDNCTYDHPATWHIGNHHLSKFFRREHELFAKKKQNTFMKCLLHTHDKKMEVIKARSEQEDKDKLEI